LRTTDSITQEIKNASDIIEVVGQYVTLKRAGKNYKGLCPFHSEKTPSFNVNPSEQYFKCFGCGVGGDVYKFMQLHHSVDFLEARQILADRACIHIESSYSDGGDITPRSEIMRVNRWAARIYRDRLNSAMGQSARDYLGSRDIDQDQVERFGLGFAPDSFDFLISAGRRDGISEKTLLDAGLSRQRSSGGNYDIFRNRLMFPIIDPSGQVLGFGGRTLGDDPAKYINTPETAIFNKSRCLYGLYQTRDAFNKLERAILVEGYTDVIMAHQHGFYETIATLGTALTVDHANIIRRYVPQAILVFDADDPGRKAAERGIEIAIRSRLDVFLAQIPDGLDPCDFLISHSDEDFTTLLNLAPSALEFKWRRTLTQHSNGLTSTARREAVEDFVSFVGTSVAFGGCDPIHRGLLVNQLTKLLGISREETNKLITEAREKAETHSLETAGAEPAGEHRSCFAQQANRPQTVEEAAALEILTVILCEPGFYSRVADVLDVNLFSDEKTRHIVHLVIGLAEQLGEFTTSELLERLEDPTDSSRVVSMVESGRSAGNLSERLDNALVRFQELECVRLSKLSEQEIVAGAGGDAGLSDEEQKRKLAELSRHMRQYQSQANNFVGARRLRASSTGQDR